MNRPRCSRPQQQGPRRQAQIPSYALTVRIRNRGVLLAWMVMVAWYVALQTRTTTTTTTTTRTTTTTKTTTAIVPTLTPSQLELEISIHDSSSSLSSSPSSSPFASTRTEEKQQQQHKNRNKKEKEEAQGENKENKQETAELESEEECNRLNFDRYFENKWETMSEVPWSLDCLYGLLDQQVHVSLQAALVRKLQVETLATAKTSQRFLIYHCVDTCGGLGDRFWAGTLTWMLSLTLKAQMGIFWQSPVHYDSYFQPVGTDVPNLQHFLQQASVLTSSSSSSSSHWLWQEYEASHEWANFTLPHLLHAMNDTSTTENKHGPAMVLAGIHNITPDTFGEEAFATMDLDAYFFPREAAAAAQVTFLHIRKPPQIVKNMATLPLFANPQLQSVMDQYRLATATPNQLMSIFLSLYARKATPRVQRVAQDLLLPSRSPSSLGKEKDDNDDSSSLVVGLQLRLGEVGNGTIGWGDGIRYGHLKDPIGCFVQQARHQCRTFDAQQRRKNKASPKRGTENDKKKKPSSCILIVTSDTPVAMERFRQAFPPPHHWIQVVESNAGPITHIDKTSGDNHSSPLLETHLRVFADWHVLAHGTDQLLISRSGYGELAALARPHRPALRLNLHHSQCQFDCFPEEVCGT